LSDGDRFFNSVGGRRMRSASHREGGQEYNGTELQTHFVYLLARAFLATRTPVDSILISVLARPGDLGQIRRLQ
jgi:hypothetical protein